MITFADLHENFLDKKELNKAIQEVWFSYKFPFRIRTHIILTVPEVSSYDLPKDIEIIKIHNVENCKILINDDKLRIKNKTKEKQVFAIDYLTKVIGEDKDGNELKELANDDDKILIPEHLEGLFVNAVKSTYNKNTSIKLLIKYSKGIEK